MSAKSKTAAKPTAAEISGGHPPAESVPWRSRLFVGLFGFFLGLSLLKFGNPPIMEQFVAAPTDVYEFLLGYPWPIGWGYALLFVLAILGVTVANWKVSVPKWGLLLPLLWLLWQWVAASESLDPQLSRPTLTHFVACTVCFYLGVFALSSIRSLSWFWFGLVCGFLLMAAEGWQQRFGGLDSTRRYFFLYIYPTLKEVPLEYLKKVSSNRIWSTLFYPNALAGALLLFLPSMLVLAWRAGGGGRMTPAARGFLVGVVGMLALGCLYWSGSKGGWLLMLLLGAVALLRSDLCRRLKIWVLVGLIIAGSGGFLWKYSGFFHRGATSVSARFDYWYAAAQTALSHPVTGTGPGTFAIPYREVKRPESEMSRLVHNDYLEQASDSGLPGFLLYTAFIAGVTLLGCRRVWPQLGRTPGTPTTSGAWTGDGLEFAVWLGLLGWVLQGILEFGLYIPALAWPAFTFMGWLIGLAGNRSTRPPLPGKV